MKKKTYDRWLPVLLAIAASIGVSITFNATDENGDGRPDSGTITFRVDGSDRDRAADDKVEVPESAVAEARPVLEKDLRDETPEEAPAAEVENAQEQVKEAERAAAQGRAPPLPTAGASQGFKGCVTKFVNNQSSRGGVRPIYQVLHYTVSGNRPGWSDVNAIVGLFNNPSFQASSHFVIDREGNCAYIVPIENNAWTQAAGNRISVAYEIINSGREGSFMDTAGYDKLRMVMKEVERRTGIPTTAGNVATGKPGAVQHKDGGIAWGGHVDITPYDKVQVIQIINQGATGSRCGDNGKVAARYRPCNYGNWRLLLDGERSHARGLLYRRRVAARNGGWSKVERWHLERARSNKEWLQNKNAINRRLQSDSPTRQRRARIRLINKITR